MTAEEFRPCCVCGKVVPFDPSEFEDEDGEEDEDDDQEEWAPDILGASDTICDDCTARVHERFGAGRPIPAGTLAEALDLHHKMIILSFGESENPEIKEILSIFPDLNPYLVFPAHRKQSKNEARIYEVLKKIDRPVVFGHPNDAEGPLPYVIFGIRPGETWPTFEYADPYHLAKLGDAVARAVDYAADGTPLPSTAR
jgi:hypothetical protein